MKKPDIKKKKAVLKPKESETLAKLSFPVIGIGASAGGLEALEQFFQNMPKNNGMAFVVIQHLDPSYVGMMPELLQRSTTMIVLQATDRLKLKPNHIYVIPPNKSLSVFNGALYLFDPIEARGLRLPIDYFFRSLADDMQDKSIGIILSGMGSDGSLGVKAIKEKIGVVLVQDPVDAKFDGMPKSAINSVIANIVASACELPAKLKALLTHNPSILDAPESETKNKSNLEKIIILLRTQTGQDFALYKKNTLFRRIERRMGVHQIDKISNYVRYLQQNPTELDILFKELLIGVTSFFRDAAVWKILKDKIFPDMFNQLPSGHILRAWVPACSTGEEAYSLAIAFKEALENDKSNKNFTLQVFATDIDKDAIEVARKGVFSANIVADVLPAQINNYFTKADEGFRVKTAIREMIVFAPHNVIKDPPFTNLNFLSCRNMLIYMEPELQKKLMALFHYSLNTDGIMLLGNAENENSQNAIFTQLDAKLKFYKRSVSSVNAELLDFPSSYSRNKVTVSVADNVKSVKVNDNIQTLAEELLLQRYAPASVLINENGDILYITGRTGKFLEPAAGKANMNIYAMAREGLGTYLISAIRKAKQNYEPVILRNIKVGTNGGTQYIDVTAQRIEKPDAIKGTVMLVFNEVAALLKPKIAKTDKLTSNTRLVELEFELQRANEELQSTREEMQTSQEELKSTNEELQSSNEELQSTNEELTTSKEEMQSLNEELQTVNAEMQSKISDFVLANNDMKNLLNSTDIATLFLDKELNIRRYTDQIKKIIKLRPTDIGRPFTEMVSDLKYPKIESDAKEVLRTLVFKESDIEASNARWFTVRIMPYRTLDDHIDGLVITFIDITKAKKLETELAITNNNERGNQTTKLLNINKELMFQNKEKQKLADELIVANRELELQNEAKQKRADELVVANKKLIIDNKEVKRLEIELEKLKDKLEKNNLL